MAKRVSITKAQAQSGAAAELVALLETITDDGRIGNSEINQLHAWIERNRDTGLGAVEYLEMTIRSITADGRVTDEERLELAKAVEKVLPPDVRDFAKQKRKLRELTDRDASVATTTAPSSSPPPVDRNAPIGSLDFVVAGVAYEGRERIVASMQPGDLVFLVRDRANTYSRNAIEVRTRHGFMVGFVPENDAVCLAPYLDQGYRLTTRVKKLWQGRERRIPVIEGTVFFPGTSVPGTYGETDVPAKRTNSTPMKNGCLGVVAIGAGLCLLTLVALTYQAS